MANRCYKDGKFSEGACRTLQTLWLVIVSSFFFRYWKSLMYALKCKRAESIGDKQSQLRQVITFFAERNSFFFSFHFLFSRNYKLNIREESDVAFIRLFECFLEAAPQKILQVSIVLGHVDKMTGE